MILRCFISFWILFQGIAIAQPSPREYAELITPADLKDNLSILASDALEGRETGTRGQKMAAAFISHHFKEIGLKPPVNGSYYQRFNLYKTAPGETYLTVRGVTYRNFKEIVYSGSDNTNGEVSIPIVFVGKGQSEDYEQVKTEGKAVLILVNEGQDHRAALSVARAHKVKMAFILNTRTESKFTDYARKLESLITDSRLFLKKPELSNSNSGSFVIAPVVAEKIFNTSLAKLIEAAGDASRKSSLKKIETGNVVYKTSTIIETVETENVLGFLEGTDKKDEVLVVTSHYDHIGKKKWGEGDLINNGADDDGSGTVAVMQMATAFMQASKDGNGPRRSILFMTVAGEENGLLGSEYYTKNPVYPLANTVVNLNIDMIGRRDENHRTSPPYVYVIGADKLSSELNELSESINRKYTKLVFDYTYNDENHPARLYYRSDHWNFAKNNIPIIFYFDGIHEDYHLPSDEVDKIEFDLLTIRSKCVFYTAWEIANRPARIAPDAR